MSRRCSTLWLPIGKDEYDGLVTDPDRFRSWLERSFRSRPEMVSTASGQGYLLEDARTSNRAGMRRTRLKATGESFSVRPSFLLPYAVGTTDDAQGQLSLRDSGVPFCAIVRSRN